MDAACKPSGGKWSTVWRERRRQQSLDGEDGACKTSGGKWSTVWRERRHQQSLGGEDGADHISDVIEVGDLRWGGVVGNSCDTLDGWVKAVTDAQHCQLTSRPIRIILHLCYTTHTITCARVTRSYIRRILRRNPNVPVSITPTM